MNDFELIKKEIIYKDKYLKEFFEYVNEKVEENDKEWFIEKSYVDCKCLGYTQNDSKFISITLADENIKKSVDYDTIKYENKFKAVLIHELGEADYQLSNLPFFTETFEDISVQASTLNEILSHYHISCILEKFENLKKIISENLNCLDRSNNETEDWKKIVRACWLLSTYPYLSLEEIEYENEYSDNIEEAINSIMNLLKDMNTLDLNADNIIFINKTKEQIRKILKSNGMPDEFK